MPPIDYDLHTIMEEEEGECDEELEDICIDDDDEHDDLAFDQQEQGAAIADPTMAELRGAAFESMKQLRASSNISREAWKKSVLADYSFDECDSSQQIPIQDLLVCLMLLVLLLCTTLVILLYAITTLR
jgi:hypothetical protein